MALFQMFYVSTMVDKGTAAFPAIHESSVRNNLRQNVTGMMLYAEGGMLASLCNSCREMVFLENVSVLRSELYSLEFFP